MTAVSDFPWRWYGALSAGVFPALVVGFVASALANRLVFVGWGLAAAVGYALLLRWGWQQAATGRAAAAPAMFWLAAAVAGFGALVARHGESLDLGYRALLWSLHHPAVARPGTSYSLAAALALIALALATAWRRAT